MLFRSYMPSELDIVAEAQVSGYTNLNLGLNPELTISQPFTVLENGHNVTKVTKMRQTYCWHSLWKRDIIITDEKNIKRNRAEREIKWN